MIACRGRSVKDRLIFQICRYEDVTLEKEDELKLSPREAARIFSALSDVTRVEIVRLVSKGPRNVSQLTSLVGVSQPKVSRHLRILRDAGILRDVRRGKWVWYEVAEPSKGKPSNVALSAISSVFSAKLVSGSYREAGAYPGTLSTGEGRLAEATARESRTSRERASLGRETSPRREATLETEASLGAGASRKDPGSLGDRGSFGERVSLKDRVPQSRRGKLTSFSTARKPARKLTSSGTAGKRARKPRSSAAIEKSAPRSRPDETGKARRVPLSRKRKARAPRETKDFRKKELEDFLL